MWFPRRPVPQSELVTCHGFVSHLARQLFGFQKKSRVKLGFEEADVAPSEVPPPSRTVCGRDEARSKTDRRHVCGAWGPQRPLEDGFSLAKAAAVPEFLAQSSQFGIQLTQNKGCAVCCALCTL